MIILVNILFPIIVWIGIHFLVASLNPTAKIIFLISLMLVLGVFGIPLLLNYNFNNWILDYLSVPVLITLVATGISFPIIIGKYSTASCWVYLYALMLNVGIQGSILWARSFGGGDYPSHYQPNPDWIVDGYYISTFYSQGFSGPAVRRFVIEKPHFNGLLYKEVVQTVENDTTTCEIIFHKSLRKDRYLFNKCTETLHIKSSL